MRLTIIQSLLLAPFLTLAASCGDSADDSDDGMLGSTVSPGGTTTGADTTGGGTASPSGTNTGGAATGGAGAAGMSAWVGRSYLLSVPEDNWIEPQGIGPEIGPHVPSFLMAVDAGTNDSVSLTITSADVNGTQEMCTPTTTVTATTGGPYPGVQIGPVDFPVHLKNQNDSTIQVNAVIRGLTISNVLPGAAPAEDGELVATMDMREIYPMFTLLSNPDADSVCSALESFEAPCEPCPTDQQLYCLTITAILLGATEATSAVTPVAAGTQAATCAGASDGG